MGASALLTAFMALPGVALAEPGSDPAAAQALFEEGRALLAVGRAAEACPKFEESQRLDPGSGTLANLAQCYEQTARLASAWSTYLDAASAARAAGNAQYARAATERATALAPRLSKLVVRVPEASRVAGLEVTRDGVRVGPAQWDVAIPANTGDHAVVATAPGRAAWHGVARVTGEGTEVVVTVPTLTPETPATDEGASATVETGSTGLSTRKILALTSGGIGVVSLGVGAVFGLRALELKEEAERGCPTQQCTTDAAAEAGNDAHDAGNVATVGLAVGLAGLAGGAVLWLTDPGGRAPVQASVGLGHVALRGTW